MQRGQAAPGPPQQPQGYRQAPQVVTICVIVCEHVSNCTSVTRHVCMPVQVSYTESSDAVGTTAGLQCGGVIPHPCAAAAAAAHARRKSTDCRAPAGRGAPENSTLCVMSPKYLSHGSACSVPICHTRQSGVYLVHSRATRNAVQQCCLHLLLFFFAAFSCGVDA